jgi:DNA-binding NtrC family response regulator
MQPHTRGSREKILLIDDDQFIAGSLRQYLLANQWDVDVAGDRSVAEELMRSGQYSVIVVDPYLTGTLNEDRGILMSAARQLQPDAALIVLTGYGSSDMQRAAIDCRATVLAKPQSILALSDVIASASQRLPISRKKG